MKFSTSRYYPFSQSHPVETNSAYAVTRRSVLLVIAASALSIAGLPQAVAGAFDDYLHAIKMDDVDTVRTLLRRGFDPNTIEPERGDSGLILALRENASKVFSLLMLQPSINLEARSRNGDTALMIAAYKGNKDAVVALLNKGAEPNRPGWTALHYAAAVGNNEIIQILLEAAAYIDAESPNKTTPIMMAARGGHILTVKLLLDEGADATIKNEAGMTAIDFARQGEFKDIVEGLTYRLRKAGKMQ
jgi:ankyrin repeat protein